LSSGPDILMRSVQTQTGTLSQDQRVVFIFAYSTFPSLKSVRTANYQCEFDAPSYYRMKLKFET
jgi:hypothetical protein